MLTGHWQVILIVVHLINTVCSALICSFNKLFTSSDKSARKSITSPSLSYKTTTRPGTVRPVGTRQRTDGQTSTAFGFLQDDLYVLNYYYPLYLYLRTPRHYRNRFYFFNYYYLSDFAWCAHWFVLVECFCITFNNILCILVLFVFVTLHGTDGFVFHVLYFYHLFDSIHFVQCVCVIIFCSNSSRNAKI